jgi:hypothetical protein
MTRVPRTKAAKVAKIFFCVHNKTSRRVLRGRGVKPRELIS